MLASLPPTDKAELDRLLAAPGEVNVEEPQEWFHLAQLDLWECTGKIISMVAGTQSGKTVEAPWLTLREIKRKFKNGHPNEHLVASPTYKLMSKKLLPEYRRVICEKLKLGDFIAGDVAIQLTDEGIARLTGQVPVTGTTVVIWFGHAQNPESLESATYMSAVLDEAGQDSFRSGSYEAVLRRLSIYEGVMYILTTPYNRNWFYEKIYRKSRLVIYTENEDGTFSRSEDNTNASTDMVVITCPSIMNPEFPRAEWEFAKANLPDWQFEMMYMGRFTRPPGAIFDSFTDENLMPRFPIPKDWPVFAGLDFGLVNTAAVLLAEEWVRGEPTGRYIVFGSYLSDKAKETRHHVKRVHELCPHKKPIAYGGAHGESGWREAWSHAGLPVFEPPFSGLWMQINTLWVAFEQNKLIVFDDMQNIIDEIRSMCRETDEDETPVPDRIKEEKKYHRIAGLRYVGARVFRNLYRKLAKGEQRDNDNLPF